MALVVGTNTYISQADATTYFDAGLSQAKWDALTSTQKDQSLITATRMLERQPWQGSKTSGAQALMWPRTGVVDKYSAPINSAAVPQQVIDAECELALAIFLNASVETSKDTAFNKKSVKAGSAEVVFFRPLRGGRFPTIIQELIGQFLSSAAAITAPLATGTDQTTKFDDCHQFDLIEGLP